MTTHNTPPLTERLDAKSLEQARKAMTVDDVDWWLQSAERHGATARARVAVLQTWCLARALPRVALIASAK